MGESSPPLSKPQRSSYTKILQQKISLLPVTALIC